MYHIEKDLNNLIVLSAVVELHITHYSLYKDLDDQLGIFLWFLCRYHIELNSFYSIVNCSSRYRNILEKSLILWDAFLHCIKYARKMGFPWSAFFCIRTESNSALIWKNTSQKKTIFWHNLHSVNSNILNNKLPEPFFLIVIHSMQDWTATTRHGVTRKRSTTRLQQTGNLFRKNLQ